MSQIRYAIDFISGFGVNSIAEPDTTLESLLPVSILDPRHHLGWQIVARQRRFWHRGRC
ncbi:MAG: hypothetical protein U0175_28605 [Caldilineaceae bacterium]